MFLDAPSVEDWDRLSGSIAGQVRAKLQGRLRDFELHHVEGAFVLRGECATYHVKQLAQEEVIGLSRVPIRRNGINVTLS
jgi:hypothetical protein